MHAVLTYARVACFLAAAAALLAGPAGWLPPRLAVRLWLAFPAALCLWGLATTRSSPWLAVQEWLAALILAAAPAWWLRDRNAPPDVMSAFWQRMREKRDGKQ